MSSILGVLYAFMLMLPTILFGADIFKLGQIMNYLEAEATVVMYQISKDGGVRPALIEELENEGITIECSGSCTYVSAGERITFKLIKYYTPIIIKKEDIEISVTRKAIVGYL
ncbi:MAG: hypothetical protein RBS24_05080 [Bacilli bacterium]|nr:hypothetical protein [Bacilli bacterium]